MSNIKLFESKQIRTVWNETDEKWYFVITDVVQVLTDTLNPSDYLKKMRKRDKQLSEGWGQIVTPLLMDTAGGKQKFNCANAKGLLRIIQSIPSPKAEPFKQWLAQVGSDRLDEIENPELATQRTRELYKAKGYPDDWIEKRMRSIAIREELTEEWKNRGVKEQLEYAILTSEISKATFGLTPSEYKKVKGLKSQNLRDHMKDKLIIIFCFVFFISISCKKDKMNYTIIGTVINKATKQPVVGLTVSLLSTKDTRGSLIPFGPTMWGKYTQSIIHTSTDSNGNFRFNDVAINTAQYGSCEYILFTNSCLSLNNGHTDFRDANLYINKGNLNKHIILEVCPFFEYLYVKLSNNTPIIFPDSFSIVFNHKYSNLRGSLPFTHTLTSSCLRYGYNCTGIQNEIMGQWYLDIYKFKGGISTISKDSIFLNYGDTMTYNLDF